MLPPRLPLCRLHPSVGHDEHDDDDGVDHHDGGLDDDKGGGDGGDDDGDICERCELSPNVRSGRSG